MQQSLFRAARLPVIVIMTLIATACDREEKVRDVQYYLDHPEKRAKVLAACEKDLGAKGITPNCVNAKGAALKAMVQGIEIPKLRVE